jgi:hypothetical protein
MLEEKNDWTWEQTLMAIVIIHGEASRRFADKFHGAIRNRSRDDWIKLQEKLPPSEKYIDVKKMDGSMYYNIRSNSIELMEVEFWRESKPNER